MKHKRRDKDGSEGEMAIPDPRINYIEEVGDDEDFFENSQDLTQLVPRHSSFRATPREEEEDGGRKKKKKKKDKRRESEPIEVLLEEEEQVFHKKKDKRRASEPIEVFLEEEEEASHKKKKKRREGSDEEQSGELSMTSGGRHLNGYRVREVDVSEIPDHLLAGMKQTRPKVTEGDEDVLTIDDWEGALTSKKGGVWILQCPKNMDVTSILKGKKFSLRGSTLLDEDSNDELELTQYIPNTVLGANVKSRQFETVSFEKANSKEGVALLLPDQNSFKIVSAPVQGHIMIREAVQVLKVPKLEVPRSKPRQLPPGVKERHPVYGADFTSILNKMEAWSGKSSKKKKRKHERDSSPPSSKQNGYNGYHNEYHYTSTPIQNQSSDFDLATSSSKKKKKKKHRDDEEYSSYNLSVNTDLSLADETQEEDGQRKRSKKSKKRKRDEMEEVNSFVKQERISDNEFNSPVVKKSKKAKYRA